MTGATISFQDAERIRRARRALRITIEFRREIAERRDGGMAHEADAADLADAISACKYIVASVADPNARATLTEQLDRIEAGVAPTYEMTPLSDSVLPAIAAWMIRQPVDQRDEEIARQIVDLLNWMDDGQGGLLRPVSQQINALERRRRSVERAAIKKAERKQARPPSRSAENDREAGMGATVEAASNVIDLLSRRLTKSKGLEP